MSVRASILVTGTEVLSGIIPDRNGPWLSERLRELGVELAHTLVVADRRSDMLAALRFMADEGAALILTTGGLGPTADDLTAEVVGELSGREMVLDEALEGRIRAILEPLASRWRNYSAEAMAASNRKQAIIPRGATILEPVGTAPGLVVPPAGGDGAGGPTVVVLPGPPRELRPMWDVAVQTGPFKAAIAGATSYRQAIMRLIGMPESALAATLRELDADGLDSSELEITTCLRRGELEIATRFEPAGAEAYRRFADAIAQRHGDALFSPTGETVDELVAAALRSRGLTIATAESCTAGLLAARLTERAGASAYVAGGVVVYSNEAKTALAGVPPELIGRTGAVSEEVALALARGAAARLEADVGVGVTGIAGPGGGSDSKPVGLVWMSAALRDGSSLTLRTTLPGARADIRDRATTVAMHVVRRLLEGERDTRS